MAGENTKEMKENKMGYLPESRLILTMSVPMMLSMMVQALYNVVDSLFVSRISEAALTAVSLAFPLQNLLIAVATGTGVGINALLSKRLGERNQYAVDKAANNGIFLGTITYLLFMIIGIFAVRPFFVAQVGKGAITEYGVQYLSICLQFSFGAVGAITFERLLMSTGKTFYSMVTQMAGAFFNIIFDPILIFGLCGFPALGVPGAAIATVGGQMLAFGLGIYFNLRVNNEIRINMKGFRPDTATIKRIYRVAVPSMIMVSIGSVMVFGLNKILLVFSSTAAAVLGVYFKLQSFIFMPLFGLNNGTVPIIAYNYGAKSPQRILKTIKLCLIYAVCVMFAGFVAVQLFARQILGCFDASENMMNIGIVALKVISIHFVIAGISVILSSVFQALGSAWFSMVISIARQIVVLLPAAYILSIMFGLDAVWWSFPIAEIVSLALTGFFFRKIYREKIKYLGRA